MNCCGISINLLSTLLLLLENVVATEVNNRINMASVNSVRCRVRCLTLLQRSLELEEAAVTLVGCLKEPQCEACLRPCSQNHMSTDFCEDACRQPEHDGACKESCQFLKQVNNIKSGRCPPETQVIGEAAMCVKACHNDADCQGVLKCCSNSCGWTCQRPTHMFDGFPEIPHRPIIKERSRPSLSSLSSSSSSSSSPSLLELKWNSVAQSNSTEQILYIVESRWSIGEHPDEDNMRNWTQITQTTETSASVEVMAGHWYQYRVTAVNIYGSRGGSEPSKTFSLSKAPRKPSPPVNFTEGDTFITGGKVSVIVHWLPPARSDLPISRYKLFWSNRPRNSPSNVMEFRQVVPGDQLNFQIPDLQPKTTYFVQIQAICQYGEGKLKSDKIGLQITTYPMEVHYANDMHHQTLQSSNGFRSMPTPSSPIGVVVDRPVYHHGNLKANVSWEFSPALLGTPRADKVALYWSPEACIADHSQDESLSKIMSATTQNSSYTIHDLRFDCRYLIRIQPTTNHGILGTMGRLTLNTPSCYDVIVVGKQRPDCPNGDVRQADEPLNLQHSFYISRSNITARISWEHPYYGSPSSSSSSSSPSSSIGYRIVWGPSGGSEASPSLTKVLPGDVTSHTLTNLKEGTTYSVKVQMLYKYGPSKPATILFTTPLLQQQQIIDSVDSYDGEEGEEDDDAEEIVDEEEEEEDDEGVDNNYVVSPVRQHRRNNNNNNNNHQPRFDWQEASIWHTSDSDIMASNVAGAGPAAEAHQSQLPLLLSLLVTSSSVLYRLCS